MMGGTDVVIEVAERSSALEAGVRRVRQSWPNAVIQDADAVDAFVSFASVPFGRIHELFVYRDQESFRSWQRLGADDANRDSMLHFIADEGELTVVVDSLDHAGTAALIKDIQALVTAGVPFALQAELRRAA